MSSSDLGGFTFPDDLPEISFADADPAPVLARMTADYEEATENTLYPADPVRLLLNAIAYELAVTRGLIDFAGKQNLLAHAQEGFEDHMGAFHSVERLEPQAATSTQRIYAEAGLAFPVSVPASLRVTPDNTLFFQIQEAATIPAAASATDEPYVDVVVKCLTAGEGGNGFLPGQITTLVDSVPYLSRTENITTSANGADTENDDHYRKRIYLAPEGYSVAGPEGAYQFYTYSAHQNIIDVAVLSPQPCDIEIYPLMSGGTLPDETVLNLVRATVTPEDTRPMGDRVTVAAPLVVSFSVSGTYYFQESDKTRENTLRAAIAAAGEAYAIWQKEKLGRNIQPDELVKRLRAAGAMHVTLHSPAFAVLGKNQVAIAGEVSLVFGGYAVPLGEDVQNG